VDVVQVLVVVLAQFKEHRAVFFVIVVVATANNLENIFKWERSADGLEVVLASLIVTVTEFHDVVVLSYFIKTIISHKFAVDFQLFAQFYLGGTKRLLKILFIDFRQQQGLGRIEVCVIWD